MFQVEADFSVIVEQQKALEVAMLTNPDTEKVVRKLIRQVILDARKQVVAVLRGKMDTDPRGASEAVRATVYKKILGGNLNIYNSTKAHGKTGYHPAKKLKPGQWGGNRRARNDRTQQIMDYGPLDRGFILRFFNNGTKSRSTIYGNRGQITPSHAFGSAAQGAIEQASATLVTLINDELAKILNKKNTK